VLFFQPSGVDHSHPHKAHFLSCHTPGFRTPSSSCPSLPLPLPVLPTQLVSPLCFVGLVRRTIIPSKNRNLWTHRARPPIFCGIPSRRVPFSPPSFCPFPWPTLILPFYFFISNRFDRRDKVILDAGSLLDALSSPPGFSPSLNLQSPCCCLSFDLPVWRPIVFLLNILFHRLY